MKRIGLFAALVASLNVATAVAAPAQFNVSIEVANGAGTSATRATVEEGADASIRTMTDRGDQLRELRFRVMPIDHDSASLLLRIIDGVAGQPSDNVIDVNYATTAEMQQGGVNPTHVKLRIDKVADSVASGDNAG